ncbi:MAG: DUF6339 family protein [Polyangiaceae bacterium]
MILARLHPDARRLVTPELMSGVVDRWSERAYAELLRDADVELELGALDAAIDRVLAIHARFEPAIDAALAEPLHRALPLSRRHASDPGIWRFLTVVHRPDVVRHRWENRSLALTKRRYWTPGTRPDSNTLARLWWIAELTRDGDDYALTTRVLERPALATALFVRQLGWYRPAVAACADGLSDAPSLVIDGTMRLLGKALSTIVVESRREEELLSLVTELRRRCEG